MSTFKCPGILGTARLVMTGVCLPRRTRSEKDLCSVLDSTGTEQHPGNLYFQMLDLVAFHDWHSWVEELSFQGVLASLPQMSKDLSRKT